MTISKIWVLAQSADGAVRSVTLDLLTKARAIASDVRNFVGHNEVMPRIDSHLNVVAHQARSLGLRHHRA